MKDNHPIRSMTGYGASSFQVEGSSYRLEIRSVNHRHINARFHMSSIFQGAENPATKALRERLGRGALDVRVAYETSQEPSGDVAVSVDLPLARALNTSLTALAEDLGVTGPSLDLLLRSGDLVRVEGRKMDRSSAEAALLEALTGALESVVKSQENEGSALAEDLKGRIGVLERILTDLESRAPEVVAGYERRLRERLDAARDKEGVEVDQGRVITELTLFAEKCDVTEEVVRAATHLKTLRELLEPGLLIRGKRLDFLVQELGREFNTVGSKCRDVGMTSAVVDAKVELERIREQVQNIA
ncbi:MAG: YicC family protein [Deltaproteobacteria bacterium]|nr:YicC family protein [Deltaproteobacteria bacterium]